MIATLQNGEGTNTKCVNRIKDLSSKLYMSEPLKYKLFFIFKIILQHKVHRKKSDLLSCFEFPNGYAVAINSYIKKYIFLVTPSNIFSYIFFSTVLKSITYICCMQIYRIFICVIFFAVYFAYGCGLHYYNI